MPSALARRFVVLTCLIVPGALAQTPDGETPSIETACDGLEGVAHGLCTAYCEAQDCDILAEPTTSCGRLLELYRRMTGEDPPCMRGPCDGGGLGRTYDVEIRINTDDEYCLWQDDVFVDCRTDWTTTGTYHVPMASGCHVIAVEGRDVFGLISGLVAVIRVDGGVVSVTGDGSWRRSPVEPPPVDWRQVAFDDTSWISTTTCMDTSPWGGAPAALIADGAQWVWDDPAGDCRASLGEVFVRMELVLP